MHASAGSSSRSDQLASVAHTRERHIWTVLHRTFDVTCAAIGLILLSPVLFLVGTAIKLDDGGPVFYVQRRIGKHFRAFRLLKFRTMISGADAAGLLTSANDYRVTRVGQLLRKYKLDELPQLFNVLKGDMQLVGARPEVAEYVDMFRRQYSTLLRDCPGITDPASIAYRCEEKILLEECIQDQYVSQVLPDKLRLSLDYQRRRTFLSDVGVLIRTVFGI